ncbi:MAG: hypothetical protein ACUVRS_09730 [Armatimonadota bacterium]
MYRAAAGREDNYTCALRPQHNAVRRSTQAEAGSGTAALRFKYVVQRCDYSPDLDYTSTDALTGTIRDLAGNPYVYPGSLPPPGNKGSLGYNKNIVIDTSGAIGQCKTMPDGSLVTLSRKVVHFKSSSTGYIEELNRSAGHALRGQYQPCRAI